LRQGDAGVFVFPAPRFPPISTSSMFLSVALTYDPHVDVENPIIRHNVLVHSLVSFFFNTVVLVGALNAIVTS
jgi:uncharacterized membrane protein